ncbi:MAG: hypothetical protein ACI8PT_000624 [Gammaproteobacteria bacterium]
MQLTKAAFSSPGVSAFRRFGVSAFLEQNIDDITVLFDQAPQIILLVANRHADFFKLPAVALNRALSANTAIVFWPELQTQSTNGLVRGIDAALGQNFFNITHTQREPHVEPRCVRNDLERKVVTTRE